MVALYHLFLYGENTLNDSGNIFFLNSVMEYRIRNIKKTFSQCFDFVIKNTIPLGDL